MKEEIDEISMEAIAQEEEELKKLITNETKNMNHNENGTFCTENENLMLQRTHC